MNIPKFTTLKYFGFAFLFLLLIIQSFRLTQEIGKPEKCIDFRNIYIGSGLLIDGKDPYDDSAIKRYWNEIEKKENIKSDTRPGLPNLALMYPMAALHCFKLFHLFDYSSASKIIQFLLILSLLILPFYLSRIALHFQLCIPYWQFFLIVAPLKIIGNSIVVGQLSLLIVLFCIIALHFLLVKRYLLFYVFFCLTCIKPSLTLALMPLFVLNKKTAIFSILLFILMFFLPAHSNFNYSHLINLNMQIQGYQKAVYNSQLQDFPLGFESISNINAGTWLCFFTASFQKIQFIQMLLLFIFILYYFIKYKKLQPLSLQVVNWSICLGLAFVYHKNYDLLLLAPFIYMLFIHEKKFNPGVLLLFILYIPFAFFEKLGIPNVWISSAQTLHSILLFVYIIVLSINQNWNSTLRTNEKVG